MMEHQHFEGIAMNTLYIPSLHNALLSVERKRKRKIPTFTINPPCYSIHFLIHSYPPF